MERPNDQNVPPKEAAGLMQPGRFYHCTMKRGEKRKPEVQQPQQQAPAYKIPRIVNADESRRRCIDLVVLNLPKTTTEANLREYFLHQIGPLEMVQLVRRPNWPKCFAFIRFVYHADQVSALRAPHLIDGRWCEVRISNRAKNDIVRDGVGPGGPFGPRISTPQGPRPGGPHGPNGPHGPHGPNGRAVGAAPTSGPPRFPNPANTHCPTTTANRPMIPNGPNYPAYAFPSPSPYCPYNIAPYPGNMPYYCYPSTSTAPQPTTPCGNVYPPQYNYSQPVYQYGYSQMESPAQAQPPQPQPHYGPVNPNPNTAQYAPAPSSSCSSSANTIPSNNPCFYSYCQYSK